MLNRLLLLLLVAALSACASKPYGISAKSVNKIKHHLEQKREQIAFYYHPRYGEVSLPNEHYSKAVRACESLYYSRGVFIGDRYETEPENIDLYRQAYADWKVKAFIAFMHAKLSPEKPQRVISTQLPSFFYPAQYLDDDVKACMSEAGWIKTRLAAGAGIRSSSSLAQMVEQLLQRNQ